jgi:hypothetical protein
MAIQLKYFVLRPRAKSKEDMFALASQEAMLTFATKIETHDPEMAKQLPSWSEREAMVQQSLTPIERRA